MSFKLALNKETFVNNILTPASKLTDSLSLVVEDNLIIKALVVSADNSIILQAKCSCACQKNTQIIVPNCKTLLRLFSNISEDNFTLDVSDNNFSYTSPSFSFKYHLLDESVFAANKSINEEKLEHVRFDTTFQIERQQISDILKFNSFIPDVEKLYFYTQDDKMFAKIGDEQRSNVNEIDVKLSDNFEGSVIDEKIPLSIQNVLFLSFPNKSIRVEINKDLKLFKFSTLDIRYIISGLVK